MLKKRKLVGQKYIALTIIQSLFSGCAYLHHVQVGQINNLDSYVSVPFEVMVSETGVSTKEIGQIAKATNSRAGDSANKVAEIVGLFQMGSRTGNPVYDEHYAEKLVYEIYQRCPSGKITGLQSIRETRKYPVISGEIVKIKGYCVQQHSGKVTTAVPKESTQGDI